MAKIRIEVFENATPTTTITIPAWVVSGASKLLPKIAGKELQEKIDLDELLELAKNPAAEGTVLEIDDHKNKQRIVISFVSDGQADR